MRTLGTQLGAWMLLASWRGGRAVIAPCRKVTSVAYAERRARCQEECC